MRTSQTHPLRIDWVNCPDSGRIGLTLCPGKKDPYAMTGPWSRDLVVDLAAICDAGVRRLVSLVEWQEFELLGVIELPARCQEFGIEWLHFPIVDRGVPSAEQERIWVSQVSATLHRSLNQGDPVLLHCRGGLGRAGIVACRLLMERGVEPAEAMARVRAARPGAVETKVQESWVLTIMGASS